ncbi:hypothetical protein Sm713_11830 [Streptomyces sp. TS71-3]|nr:hypothetical protein Sm713_11830 [Streptomyces sp. TS71-3]
MQGSRTRTGTAGRGRGIGKCGGDAGGTTAAAASATDAPTGGVTRGVESAHGIDRWALRGVKETWRMREHCAPGGFRR